MRAQLRAQTAERRRVDVRLLALLAAGKECQLRCGARGRPSADGLTCVCSDNTAAGEECELRCGAHGQPSTDGLTCVCSAGYFGMLCDWATSYVISGSNGRSDGGDLDGTYSLVEAHCGSGSGCTHAKSCNMVPVSTCMRGRCSVNCDARSPTTCGGNVPVFQKGGGWAVLYRYVDIRDGSGLGWEVADSGALASCRSGSRYTYAHRSLNPGQLPSTPGMVPPTGRGRRTAGPRP